MKLNTSGQEYNWFPDINFWICGVVGPTGWDSTSTFTRTSTFPICENSLMCEGGEVQVRKWDWALPPSGPPLVDLRVKTNDFYRLHMQVDLESDSNSNIDLHHWFSCSSGCRVDGSLCCSHRESTDFWQWAEAEACNIPVPLCHQVIHSHNETIGFKCWFCLVMERVWTLKHVANCLRQTHVHGVFLPGENSSLFSLGGGAWTSSNVSTCFLPCARRCLRDSSCTACQFREGRIRKNCVTLSGPATSFTPSGSTTIFVKTSKVFAKVFNFEPNNKVKTRGWGIA